MGAMDSVGPLMEALWGELFLGGLWKGSAVLLAALLVAGLARRASAARRHAVWALALISLLALPLLSAAGPRWSVALPALLPAPPGSTSATATVPGLSAGLTVNAAPLAAPAVIGWREGVLLLWLAGAGALLGSLLLAVARAARETRGAPPLLDPRLEASVATLSRRMRVRRAPALREAGPGAMPMVGGVVRPVLLLPRGAGEWPEEKLRAVLVHELAHLRRDDLATQLLSRVACALFWYNPLAWVALARVRRESESACDDAVLAAGVRPTEYAAYLLEFARTARGAGPLAAVASPMAEPSQLRGRIEGVLAERRDRAPLSGRALAVYALPALALLVGVAAAEPARQQPPEPARPVPPRQAERPLTPAVPAAPAAPATEIRAPDAPAVPAEPDPAIPAPGPVPPAPAGGEASAGPALPSPAAPSIPAREVAPAAPRVILSAGETRPSAARGGAPVQYSIVPRGPVRASGSVAGNAMGEPGCRYIELGTVEMHDLAELPGVTRRLRADRVIGIERATTLGRRAGEPEWVEVYRGTAVRFVSPGSRENPGCL